MLREVKSNRFIFEMKGALMLFPPIWTHEHRAQVVKKGVRYIATTRITFR